MCGNTLRVHCKIILSHNFLYGEDTTWNDTICFESRHKAKNSLLLNLEALDLNNLFKCKHFFRGSGVKTLTWQSLWENIHKKSWHGLAVQIWTLVFLERYRCHPDVLPAVVTWVGMWMINYRYQFLSSWSILPYAYGQNEQAFRIAPSSINSPTCCEMKMDY